MGIASSNGEDCEKAEKTTWPSSKTRRWRYPFYGKVVRIMSFGAFVEIAPGKDGLIHISKLDNRRVEKVEDVLNIGDMTWVKVIEIDDKGRINLSRRDAIAEIYVGAAPSRAS